MDKLLTQKEQIEKHNKKVRQQKYRAIKKLRRIGRLI